MKKNLKDKKSLNIAMLGHKRIPSREGGIEIVVEELATRMVTLGHKVTCYNRSGHHVSGKDFDGGKRKAYKGVRLKSVLTLDKKGLAAMTASVSGAICAAFGKYDVVHFHAEGPCAMLWLPKLFGKRCVATVHGLDHQRAKWGKLASTYIMMGEKCAVKFADEIIVLSKGVQDYFKETYGRETKFIPNAELTQQTANLMDKYNQIADKIAENGYIATWCTENYARLMLLWLRRNDYRSAANCWKQMMKFQQRFADDEDILKAIAGAADALYDIYRENQVPGRRCKLLKDMERIFDETHNADVANALAILEANEHTIYDPPAVFDSNKSEILLSTENKLKEIYEVFPNEGKVVLGYSYLVSWNYVTWLDFPRPIDEELIPLFKKWIRKFPENKLELMEYYSFILFEKWLYMDSLDNISEANKIYYEIKAIADELSKDYADNQVTQMLSMGIVRKL